MVSGTSRALEALSPRPSLWISVLLSTAWRLESENPTGPGANDRAAAGDSVSDSEWPQLGPHFLQKRRLRLPRGAGRGGSHGDPPPGWEGAGKGRGARRMCGSACLPGGGAGSPARPLTSSPQVGQELPSSHHERPQEVTGRGGVRALSPAELPSRPGLRRFGSRDPPAPRKLLPSSPHPLQGAQTPEPSWRPGPGDSQGGGQCREVPRPLHFPVTPTGKLSHRLPPSPVTSAGRDPPQIPTPIRGKEPQPPRNRPAPLETSPGAFAAPGRVLPLFLALMVSPGQPPGQDPFLPTPRVHAGPGPLGAGPAGLCACSQRLWLGLKLLPAPPPAQFLPPDSARRDGAGRAGLGGQHRGLGPPSLWEG